MSKFLHADPLSNETVTLKDQLNLTSSTSNSAFTGNYGSVLQFTTTDEITAPVYSSEDAEMLPSSSFEHINMT